MNHLKKVTRFVHDDWCIAISYILVLVSGFVLGSNADSIEHLLVSIKSLLGIVIPISALGVATAGLQTWRKAERLKLVSKLADELRRKVKSKNISCSSIYYELNALIQKRRHLQELGEDEVREPSKSLMSSFRKVEYEFKSLGEIYKDHFDELYIVDKALLNLVDNFLYKTSPFEVLRLEVRYKDDPEQLMYEWFKRITNLSIMRLEIYEELLKISAAEV